MKKPDHFSTPFKKVQKPILRQFELSKGSLNATVSTLKTAKTWLSIEKADISFVQSSSSHHLLARDVNWNDSGALKF